MIRLLPAFGLFLCGALLCILEIYQPVTLTVDGVTASLPGGSLTGANLLARQGITYRSSDHISPPIWMPLVFTRQVSLNTSAQVEVYDHANIIQYTSTERRPYNLLLEAGIKIFPYDSLFADGQIASTGSLLPPATLHTLQYRAAQWVTLREGGLQRTFYSSAPTIGGALWEQGIPVGPGDLLDPPYDTPLEGPTTITLQRGRELLLVIGGESRFFHSSAETVGTALKDAGATPQGLDYCVPAENEPIPPDGVIHLVRVREEVLLNQITIPNTIEYQADPNTELDQQSIIDPGQVGVQITQVRVRYENGNEVSRQSEAQWIAREAKPQIIGYGTKVVIRTIQVDGNTIEYWRSVTVYATSYSPCNSGVAECLGKTANGMTVEKGVVGVIRSWYNLMNGQRIYVPGYGTAVIADIGAGFAGKDWIDLGYSDSDYIPWHSTITIYFLTPVPANIPWILP